MKMKIILLIFTILTIQSSILSSDGINYFLDRMKEKPHKEIFKSFHYLFEKQYKLNSDDGLKRYRIFKKNLRWIEEENKKLGEQVYGITQFADMIHEEYVEKTLMKPEIIKKYVEEMNSNSLRFLHEEENHHHHHHNDDHNDHPKRKEEENNQNSKDSTNRPTEDVSHNLNQQAIDWRQWDGPIKDQGLCGSCWAFAALAPIENIYNKLKGVYTPFSEQYLINCNRKDDGCKGGYPTNTMEWIKINGIVHSDQQKYIGRQAVCDNTKKSLEYKILNGYKMVDSKNTWDSLFRQGPLIVGMDASFDGFELYKPLNNFAPITPNRCLHSTHALAVVAQIVENGKTYLIGRNSWGLTWGYKGYVKIPKEKNCNMTQLGWLPLINDGFSPNVKPNPQPTPPPVDKKKCVEVFGRGGFATAPLGKFCDSKSELNGTISGVRYEKDTSSLVLRLFQQPKCIGTGVNFDSNVVIEGTTEFPKLNGVIQHSQSFAFVKRANEGCADFYTKPCHEGESSFSICNDIKDSQDVNLSGLKTALSVNFDSLKIRKITFYSQPHYLGNGYSLDTSKAVYNLTVQRQIYAALATTRSIKIENK
jgi:C1A family cysteine protease